jgi:hypothetical protein
MWCHKHRSTLTTDACIKRQKIAQQNFVTLKTVIREGVYHCRQVNAPESFADCANCQQGTEVQRNPAKYTNADVQELSRTHIIAVTRRGYVHRDRLTDLNSLKNAGDIEKAELNYIEGKHNVNVDLIGRNAVHSIKRRKKNGRSQVIIGSGKAIVLSDRTIRIIRYLCKQGHFARSQSYFLQSLGLCAAVG